MSTEHFDDELLSDVLDGAADEQTVAAVNADPAARARLARLRAVVDIVGTPPPPATPERRAQSIAAAVEVAATPTPVASLAPVRQARFERRRRPVRWLAAAAAAMVALLAIPVIGSLGDEEAFDTATEMTADSESQSLGGDLGSGSAEGGDSSDDASPAAADAMEESAVAPAEASGADTAADAADLATDGDDSIAAGDEADAAASTTSTASFERSIPVVNDPAELAALIDDGTIELFTIGAPSIVENVTGDCLAAFEEVTTESFGLARLASFDAMEQLLLLYLDDSGEITALDGEDCSPVG